MSESGDWYCRNCGYITSARVTHSETCDQCHIPVEWHDAEQQDELTTLRAKVAELEAAARKVVDSEDRFFQMEANTVNVCARSLARLREALPTPPEDKSDG